MSTTENIQEVPLYWWINNRLGEWFSEQIEKATSLVLDRTQGIFQLKMKAWWVEEIALCDDMKREVLQEVDNLLSFWKLNQYLWRKHHFAFPTRWQRVIKWWVEVDHKTSNILKRVWRWASLFMDPWMNIWERYMNWWYDVSSPWMEHHEALEIFLTQLYTFRKFLDSKPWYRPIDNLLFKKRRGQKNDIESASDNISEHYDFWNPFYVKLLEQWWLLEEFMQYSCWVDGTLYPEVKWLELKQEQTLEAMQWNKMKIHCEKMWLQPWMKVLDVGCGWWSLAKFMYDEYGVEVIWVTLSGEQFDLATERNKDCENVTIIKSDVRELPDGMKFDRIVSIWAFEHFRDFYKEFFEKSAQYLNQWGLMSLHTIWTSKKWEVARFFQKYIFPGWYLPTKWEVLDSSAEYFKPQEDWRFPNFEDLWEHYARTLDFWIENLVSMKDSVIEEYWEKAYRMFMFYLVWSKVSFRDGYSELHQYILEKR